MDTNLILGIVGVAIPCVGFVFAVVFWLRGLKSDIVSIKTNHIPHLQKALDELPAKLKEAIADPIIDELKQQRLERAIAQAASANREYSSQREA